MEDPNDNFLCIILRAGKSVTVLSLYIDMMASDVPSEDVITDKDCDVLSASPSPMPKQKWKSTVMLLGKLHQKNMK